MRLAYIAFTKKGKALADRLAEAMGGRAVRAGKEVSLGEWTRESFAKMDGLVFVGAAGIAVRAIAPFVSSKASDPAVVVVDEGGRYAIPILSGHLGGANDLARRICVVCGAEAVITTATDREGIFAVDEWAKRQGMAILNPEKIKEVSAALLEGETIGLHSDWPIEGKVPKGLILTGGSCQIRVSYEETDFAFGIWAGENENASSENTVSGDKISFGVENKREALRLVPKILTLGVGCRKGIEAERIEQVFLRFLQAARVSEKAIVKVCSIDRKKEEAGLRDFCRRHGFAFRVYCAEELASAEGKFTSSDYVLAVTGVDNVCERSAVLGSGGSLIAPKWAEQGVTMALAAAPFHPDWRWLDE